MAHRWLLGIFLLAAATGLPLLLLTPLQRAALPWLLATHGWMGAAAIVPLAPVLVGHARRYRARSRRREHGSERRPAGSRPAHAAASGFLLTGRLAWWCGLAAVLSGVLLWLPTIPALASTVPLAQASWLRGLHTILGLATGAAALAHVLLPLLEE